MIKKLFGSLVRTSKMCNASPIIIKYLTLLREQHTKSNYLMRQGLACPIKGDSYWKKLFTKKKVEEKIIPEKSRPNQAKHSCEFDKIPDFVEEMQKNNLAIIKTAVKTHITELPLRDGLDKKCTQKDLIPNIQSITKSIEDPCTSMPTFTTVGQRWIDLQKRKIHPFYKMYGESKVYKLLQDKSSSPQQEISRIMRKTPQPDIDLNRILKQKREKMIFHEFKKPNMPQLCDASV